MNNKPDQVIMDVRYVSGTYIATCKEVKMRASCTEGERSAAQACAEKIYFGEKFTLKQVGDKHWSALLTSKTEAPHGATTNGSAWRKPEDLPDSDITVLLRVTLTDYQIMFGYHDGEEWVSDSGATMELCIGKSAVLGWMHLEDAARILDAATL